MENELTKFSKSTPQSINYNMPIVNAIHNISPVNLVPFNCANTHKNKSESFFHFYIYDSEFERLWNNPLRYLNMMHKFKGCISPDFSIYLSAPLPIQMWNSWRNKLLTAWLQNNGIPTIPNVGWSDERSYDWAFEGIPEHSVLSVTNQGCMKNYDYISKRSFINGLHELVRRKSPEKIYIYGLFDDTLKDRFSVPIEVLPTFSEQTFRKKGCA